MTSHRAEFNEDKYCPLTKLLEANLGLLQRQMGKLLGHSFGVSTIA